MPASPDKKRGAQARKSKLGKAMTAEREVVRARALAADLLNVEDLDRRQENIGVTRKFGGAPLDGEPSEEQEESISNVPQTNCED